VLLDLGSGDGAGVVQAARTSASTLCVGIDTDASAAREASARAAQPARKGGLPNALFLVGDARTPPQPFIDHVDELRIVLPWGSLLRAVLDAERDLVATIAEALRPAGRLRVLASLLPRDMANVATELAGNELAGTDLAALADALEKEGLVVTDRRAVTSADLRTMRSSWARRLGVPDRRPAETLEARLPPLPDAARLLAGSAARDRTLRRRSRRWPPCRR
jgi:SAM-dependent methyltransferase